MVKVFIMRIAEAIFRTLLLTSSCGSCSGGQELGGFQLPLKPRIEENQAQLILGELFRDLKPLFSRHPLNA